MTVPRVTDPGLCRRVAMLGGETSMPRVFNVPKGVKFPPNGAACADTPALAICHAILALKEKSGTGRI